MNYIDVLINQIGIMFITIFIGFFIRKAKIIDDNFVKTLGNVMLLVINPLSIFKSFITDYTDEKAKGLLICAVISIVMFSITVLLAQIFFHKEKYCIESYATVVNNCGFFGFPIVTAVLGANAVFFAVPYLIVNVTAQYTYGTYVLSRDKKNVSFKKIITNSNIIATILGFIFFFAGIKVPSVVYNTCTSLSSLLGPLCAIIIGSNLANTDFKDIKNDATGIIVCLIRLIIVPITCIFLLKNFDFDMTLKLTMVIILSTPSGSSTTMLSRNYNKDSAKAARIVSVCSLLTIITMPLMLKIVEYVW